MVRKTIRGLAGSLTALVLAAMPIQANAAGEDSSSQPHIRQAEIVETENEVCILEDKVYALPRVSMNVSVDLYDPLTEDNDVKDEKKGLSSLLLFDMDDPQNRDLITKVFFPQSEASVTRDVAYQTPELEGSYNLLLSVLNRSQFSTLSDQMPYNVVAELPEQCLWDGGINPKHREVWEEHGFTINEEGDVVDMYPGKTQGPEDLLGKAKKIHERTGSGGDIDEINRGFDEQLERLEEITGISRELTSTPQPNEPPEFKEDVSIYNASTKKKKKIVYSHMPANTRDIWLVFDIMDPDGNLTDITAEIKYHDDDDILHEANIWSTRGRGEARVTSSTFGALAPISLRRIEQDYGKELEPGVGYSLRLVTADSRGSYDISNWVNFVIAKPGKRMNFAMVSDVDTTQPGSTHLHQNKVYDRVHKRLTVLGIDPSAAGQQEETSYIETRGPEEPDTVPYNVSIEFYDLSMEHIIRQIERTGAYNLKGTIYDNEKNITSMQYIFYRGNKVPQDLKPGDIAYSVQFYDVNRVASLRPDVAEELGIDERDIPPPEELLNWEANRADFLRALPVPTALSPGNYKVVLKVNSGEPYRQLFAYSNTVDITVGFPQITSSQEERFENPNKPPVFKRNGDISIDRCPKPRDMAYATVHPSIKDLKLRFHVEDSDSNLVDLTAEIRYQGDDKILTEVPVWDFYSKGKGVDLLHDLGTEEFASVSWTEAGLTPGKAYEIRLVAADIDKSFVVSNWLSFAKLEQGQEREFASIEDQTLETDIQDRVDRRVDEVVDSLKDKYRGEATQVSSDEFYSALGVVDDFFNSGFIAYSTRNEMVLDMSGLHYNPSENEIVYITLDNDMYVFGSDGSVIVNEEDYDFGENPEKDLVVAEGVSSSLIQTLEYFEGLDFTDTRYTVAEPGSPAYQKYMFRSFVTGTSHQLYNPDSSMGQMFVQEAMDQGLEFDFDNDILIAMETEEGFDYSLWP